MNKWKIILAIWVFTLILIVCMFVLVNQLSKKQTRKYIDEIESLQSTQNSLLLQLKEKDDKILQLQKSVSETKVKIVYLREEGNEKIDSVYNLPLDSAVEFYPKKQIIQGDTVVVITPNQLKIINGIIQERNGYKTQIVPQYEQLVSEQDSLIQVLNLKVVDWEQINATNQSIISNLNLQNEEVLRQKRRGC